MTNQDKLALFVSPLICVVFVSVGLWTASSIAMLEMLPFYTGEGLMQNIGRAILAFSWVFFTVRVYNYLTDPLRKLGL